MSGWSTDLEHVSRVGFGSYRTSAGNAEHRAALHAALRHGCRLVDTAPHYGDGRAEELIGDVLAGTGYPAFVITKAGYFPLHVAEVLGLDSSLLTSLDHQTGFSLAPAALSASIGNSRQRLESSCLDAVCLHNPENLGDPELALTEATKAVLFSAFSFLENEVEAGRLRWYGISSNALSSGTPAQQVERVERIVDLAHQVRGRDHHLRILQFPWNLLEHAAGSTDIFKAIRDRGIRSVAHRAINARWQGKNVRLIDGPPGDVPDVRAARAALDDAVALVTERLASLEIRRSPWDFAALQFLRDAGLQIEHPDLVDLIFTARVWPFVQTLFGEDGDGAAGRSAFRRVEQHCRQRAAYALSEESRRIRADLVDRGVLAEQDPRPLAQIAASYPLESGADHVLVGMRRREYVEQFVPLMSEDDHGGDPATRQGASRRAVHIQLSPAP